MKIIFHGRLADLLGREMELASAGPCSIAELRLRIAEAQPAAADVLAGKRVRACVGDAFVDDDHLAKPGDEVEFLPPVSGG